MFKSLSLFYLVSTVSSTSSYLRSSRRALEEDNYDYATAATNAFDTVDEMDENEYIETEKYGMDNNEEYNIYEEMDMEGEYEEFDEEEELYNYDMVEEDYEESDEEESQLYLLDEKINQDMMMGNQDVEPPQRDSAGYIIGQNPLVSKEDYDDLDKESIEEEDYGMVKEMGMYNEQGPPPLNSEDYEESDEEEYQFYLLDEELNQEDMNEMMPRSSNSIQEQNNEPIYDSAGYIVGENPLVSQEDYDAFDKEIAKEYYENDSQ